jgi:hypothetical protein
MTSHPLLRIRDASVHFNPGVFVVDCPSRPGLKSLNKFILAHKIPELFCLKPENEAHLVDHVFPEAPVRQFVLTFPYPLRFLPAAEPKALTEVLAVVYRCKRPFRDGSTHVVLERLDFMARLAALVPGPRLNPRSNPGQALTRFRGVFAPNFKHGCTRPAACVNGIYSQKGSSKCATSVG